MIVGGIGGLTTPGSEQKDLWGSQSADVDGSNNIIGIKNPAADYLIQKLIETKDNELYTAYVKALDRVLLFNHYVIFNWIRTLTALLTGINFPSLKPTIISA